MPKSLSSLPSGRRQLLSPMEWQVLKACVRLGPGTSTSQIFREVQGNTLLDYRHVGVLLRRLADRRYMAVAKQGPRRLAWTPEVSAEKMIYENMREITRELVGDDHQLLATMRGVLDELEAEIADGSAGDSN